MRQTSERNEERDTEKEREREQISNLQKKSVSNLQGKSPYRLNNNIDTNGKVIHRSQKSKAFIFIHSMHI